MTALYSDPTAARAGLSLLDYLSELFTGAGKEEFSKVDVLTIFNAVRSHPALFEPEAMIAYQEATAELEEAAN